MRNSRQIMQWFGACKQLGSLHEMERVKWVQDFVLLGFPAERYVSWIVRGLSGLRKDIKRDDILGGDSDR